MDKYAAIIFGLALLIGCALLLNSARQYDETDPPGGRSGLGLMTDYGTGCQYLYYRSAMVPRMGKDGKQICKDKLQ